MSTGDHWPYPNTVVMYGMSPDPLTPRLPAGWPLPSILQPASVQPMEETAETIVARLKQRIADLERELKMHEAWKLELVTLQRMLKAYEGVEP